MLSTRRILSGTTATLLLLVAAATPGCESDGDTMDGEAGTTACVNSGGPVVGPTDMHCIDDSGMAIIQSVGKCVTDTGGGVGGASGQDDDGAAGHAAGAAGEGDHGEEEYLTLYSNHGSDDDCKYDVSFTNGCIELEKPVTFKVTLFGRETGSPARKAHPDSPEVFLADDPSHISPSFQIKAPEGPDGTYAVGPIVFDKAGRWVVRFHFYETCSDIPEDSPHGHAGFYIDVP